MTLKNSQSNVNFRAVSCFRLDKYFGTWNNVKRGIRGPSRAPLSFIQRRNSAVEGEKGTNM